jgi:hypothetical protein
LSCTSNTLDDIVASFLCDSWRLGKDNGEPSLMSLDLGVIPFLEQELFIGPLMFHGGFSTHFDARVEDVVFDDSNSMKDM